MEKNGIFHIHIDARVMPEEFEQQAIQHFGFTITDFEGHPDGYVHFEPIRHLTLKLRTADEYREVWKKLETEVDAYPNFVGYLEGEYVPIDEVFPDKPYRDLPIPFHVSRRRLRPERNEVFRQTEFHLTLEKNMSNSALIKKLLDSGLYGAYLPKKDGTYLVLTMQGFKKDIDPLMQKLREFILESGGAFSCTLKEERAIGHKLCGIDPADLPEIADNIEYFI